MAFRRKTRESSRALSTPSRRHLHHLHLLSPSPPRALHATKLKSTAPPPPSSSIHPTAQAHAQAQALISSSSSLSSSSPTLPTAGTLKVAFSSPAANMSTMPAQHGHSQACCNLPPVVSKGYTVKGTYEDLGGYKTYVTGPKDAEKGILTTYDIFGYYDQTLQGADILSTSDDKQNYQVFMPDWFKGNAAPIEWYPPDTPDKQKKLGDWFSNNPPHGVAKAIPDYIKEVSKKHPEIKSWAIMGFCFGGKVVSLVTSSPDNIFKAAVECHPAMVDPSEAKDIKVPFCMLASKDEPAEDVKKFEDALTGPKHVEIFGDQIHGWMAARSDLSDPRVKEEYIRGYETVLKFLSKHV
ncbi:Alpha/Beta hydrolase protein [Xylariales sp. PMI_506]|nr:Alpha/Beta hydrolase protein [Xylariales sp. PMI_506]